jgi:hypothetical protein
MMRHRWPDSRENGWNGFTSRLLVVRKFVSCCRALSRRNINFVLDAGTEWHQLQVKSSQDGGELRNRLRAMLDLFPQWNRWEEMGHADDATSTFENLVDSTWWCDGSESIARFVN